MILDTLENSHRYFESHPLFEQAFKYVLDNPHPEPGTFEINGKDIYAIVSRSQSEPPKEPKLEAHQKYIDIQVALNGSFDIGWKPLKNCTNIFRHTRRKMTMFSTRTNGTSLSHCNPEYLARFFLRMLKHQCRHKIR